MTALKIQKMSKIRFEKQNLTKSAREYYMELQEVLFENRCLKKTIENLTAKLNYQTQLISKTQNFETKLFREKCKTSQLYRINEDLQNINEKTKTENNILVANMNSMYANIQRLSKEMKQAKESYHTLLLKNQNLKKEHSLNIGKLEYYEFCYRDMVDERVSIIKTFGKQVQKLQGGIEQKFEEISKLSSELNNIQCHLQEIQKLRTQLACSSDAQHKNLKLRS